MGSQKPRILPWLVSQLDEGRLEGVAWLGQSRRRFRIPWKHGLRQDAQQEDFGIFQAWAEASGAYTPGRDKPDLPTWKRNFRSALNRKEGLRLAEDHSKDPQDPHKVYEFVNSAAGDFPEPEASPDTDGRFSTSDTQESVLEGLVNGMNLGPIPDEGASGLAVSPEYHPQLLLSPNSDIPAPYPTAGPPENPLKQLLVLEEDWEFEVTAFYRGRQVFQQTVFCPGGLRLAGPEGGDRTLPGQPITLPAPEALLADRVAKGYVSRVLSGLAGGLALWRAGQGLCAQRLGPCHAYWAVGEELLPDSSRGPDGEVPKETAGSVFNLGPFVTDLIAFIEGSKRSPRYTFWFCMGESWPQDQPWTKKLVMVKVVPTCLRALVEMARVGGASSLENTSLDLHISNSQPLSLTSEQYKAYLQDLVEDMDF
ncbi:interferon regulatory factor 3 isoform X3 [Pipistrellus kuhlii]|nr:interferon regulatory factor 3 isoform X3 [Pipistrellus kuhlii]XP_036281638.1 interferon regulatory factor 3 isoform X3 [Pipistrellus kuhlii]XP_036281639.1 interferon regulatory factor 3 isoform X3 [Pipistrellus kuhlii]XP_045433113.1 interferon regulatory factor 3 isoform X3 [Pipistrellus kuhlii]KAF6273726.1 interferon regulatory factor 3 [Pipistrellus kuhlii]